MRIGYGSGLDDKWECEARWQCLPKGRLSLSKQGDGSKVAHVTSSISPQGH
jgi:hypothetical protein